MSGIDAVEKTTEKNEEKISSPVELFEQIDRFLKSDTAAGIEKGQPAKFYDANGKIVENLMGLKEPVISVSVAANGDAHVSIYPTGEAARARSKEPELLVVVSRSKEQDVTRETRSFFEPVKGGSEKPTAVVSSEINAKENTATITASAGDQKQIVTFKNGSPESIEQRNPKGELKCLIGVDGKIKTLMLNGKEPTAESVPLVLDALQKTADLVATENGFPRPARLSFKEIVVKDVAEAKITSDKITDVSKFAPEQRKKIEETQELQGQILALADKFPGSQEEKDRFKQSLIAEMGVKIGADKFVSLPQFGSATKEGFKRLIELHERITIPGTVKAMDMSQLSLVPGLPLEFAGPKSDILVTEDHVRKLISDRKAFLNINPEKVDDVDKLRKVNDWLEQSANKLEKSRYEKLSEFLGKKVEEGIASGKYPESFRRPKDMDVQTWTVAVDKAMSTYERARNMIEMIDHMQSSKNKFKSDALLPSELPPGLELSRDKNGKIQVKFTDLMISDLSLQSDDNRKKLDMLNAYVDRFEGSARAAMLEILKDQTDVAGYGEVEVKDGWVSPDSKDFVVGRKDAPGPGWQKFNLVSYNMGVETVKLESGTKIRVSTECSFEEVPWYGYLNSFAETKHTVRSKNPVDYNPEDWVAVQTRQGVDETTGTIVPNIQLVKAKDLAAWKEQQALLHYGNKGIMLTMDGAMAISGTLHVAQGLKLAAMGTEAAIKAGAQVLKTEAITHLPKHAAARVIAGGTGETILGVTGIVHNAGAHEIPWMKALGDIRTAYFLSHAGYSVAQLLRLPRAAGGVLEAVSPSAAAGIRNTLDTIRGSEQTIKALAQANAGALSKLPGAEGIEKGAHYAFAVSDKAFLTMFSFDMLRLGQMMGERPEKVNEAFKAFKELNLNDRRSLDKLALSTALTSDQVEAHFKRFRGNLSSPTADFNIDRMIDQYAKLSSQALRPEDRERMKAEYRKAFQETKPEADKKIDQISARVAELMGPNAKPSEREKYVQELMGHLRYSPEAIAKQQSGRERALDATELAKLAGADNSSFDPNVRRVAALALLTLTRKPDGSWPETIVSERQKVPDYQLTHIDSEGNTHHRTVSGEFVLQQIKAKELIDLLQEDLRVEKDAGRRLDKTLALHDAGLTSNEHVADLLLKRIKGDMGHDKEKQLQAIVELASIISKVRVNESISDALDSNPDKRTRKGLTIGLTSSDLLRRVEEIAANAADKDVRSTLIFAHSLMSRDALDQVDKQRIEAAFLKKPPGITEEQLKSFFQADLTFAQTEKSGWERKYGAAEALVKVGLHSKTLDVQAAKALQECLKSNEPGVSLKALKTLLEKHDDIQLIDRLESAQPGQWKKPFLFAANDLVYRIEPSKAATPLAKLEAAKVKEELIPLVSALAATSNNTTVVGNLSGLLQPMTRRQGESIQELRAAAINGLAALNVRDEDTIKAIQAALSAESEPSPMVRLAAVHAFIKLGGTEKEKKDVLGPLAVAERDPAVRTVLAKYYEPAGSHKDAGSQKSEQAVKDLVVQHDKPEIKRDEVRRYMETSAKNMLMQDDYFKYMNASQEFCDVVAGRISLQQRWNTAKRAAEGGGWHAVGSDHLKSAGRTQLIETELLAQNRAYRAYMARVDQIVEKAMVGDNQSTSVAIGKGVTERDAAVLMLGYLVSSDSQMGDKFSSRRKFDENNKVTGTERYSEEESKLRLSFALSDEGRKEKLEIFQGDPWLKAQPIIAGKLVELLSASKGTVDVSLIKDQLLAGLASGASTTDETRVVLVKGLEKILANPETSENIKREIVSKVSKLLGETQEADQDKKKALPAMIQLIDTYSKQPFYKYSEQYNQVRDALNARAQVDSVTTPRDTRMAAQELYDREWQSVVNEFASLAVPAESIANRVDRLKKIGSLVGVENAKTDTKVDRDEVVHQAVQSLVLSVKGMPLTKNDPRLQQIEALTGEKYNPRLRVAAMMALSESSDPDIRKTAAGKLYTYALDNLDGRKATVDFQDEVYHRALRNDAFKLLEKLPSAPVSEANDLEQVKINWTRTLAEAMGHKTPPANWAAKSSDDLIAMADKLCKEKSNTTNARERESVAQVRRMMHVFAEASTIVGSQLLKSGKHEEARKMYSQALSAFGLDEAMIDRVSLYTKESKHYLSSSHPEMEKLTAKLMESIQDSGSYPALLHALNGQAKLKVYELGNKSTPLEQLVKSQDTALGLLSLSNSVSNRYHPQGTIGRADFLMETGEIIRRMGAPRTTVLDHKEKYSQIAANFFNEATKQYEDFSKRRSDVPVGHLIARSQQEATRADLGRYADFINQKSRLKEPEKTLSRLSKELDESLAKINDKTATEYHHLKFLKHSFDMSALPMGQREQARQNALTSLNDMLGASRKAHGGDSAEYNFAMTRLREFYAVTNKDLDPKPALDYFKKALEEITRPAQKGERLRVLDNYYAFLRQKGMHQEAESICLQRDTLARELGRKLPGR